MPKTLFPKNFILPPLAQEFIARLKITSKPSTCHNYSVCLKHLYYFLEKNNINIKSLTTKHTNTFFATLVDAQLAVVTRRNISISIRVYLRWLYEQELIATHPYDLIRTTDLPRRPLYLPRPLPAEIDETLQKRLHNSTSIYHKGLLLMRHTGIRVGELVDLPINCIYTDSRQVHFLKVPLGKLDNERNVPLDTNTYRILEKIQLTEPTNREYLIPRCNRNKTSQTGHMRKALKKVSADIKTENSITSHRFRHTYATTLLNAGVPLVGLMKLLGHRDYRMTLRYAAVTQETLLTDYFNAIKNLEYATKMPTPSLASDSPPDPTVLLDETEKLLKKLTADNQFPTSESAAILKKLAKLKNKIGNVLRNHHKMEKMAR